MTSREEILNDPDGAKFCAGRWLLLAPFRRGLLKLDSRQLRNLWAAEEPRLQKKMEEATKNVHRCLWEVRKQYPTCSDVEAQLKSAELRGLLERRWEENAVFAVFHHVVAERARP